MKAFNAIVPRGLQVLLILAILAVLVWQFAPGDFLYPVAGLAALLAIGLIFAIYRSPGAISETNLGEIKYQGSRAKEKSQKEPSDVKPAAGSLAMEDTTLSQGYGFAAGKSSVGLNPSKRLNSRSSGPKDSGYRYNPDNKPDAVEITARYYQMAAAAKAREEESDIRERQSAALEGGENIPDPGKTLLDGMETGEKVFSQNAPEVPGMAGNLSESQSTNLPMPIINEETTLTEEDKSALENAVWYRCENPYCKYSHFLDVHHIIDEKNGGNNKLINLIVLCPYCHDLAHRNEIPEEEMREWISHREEGLKFKLEWPYL